MYSLVVVAALCMSVAIAGSPITQAGAGCGTWFITEADCKDIPASDYWTYNFTFTPGSVATDTVVQIAITSNPEKWGIYSIVPSTGCTVQSTAGCGTFSSLTACTGSTTCDPALQPVCQANAVAGGGSRPYYFSIRKNNAGAGCATTIAVFLQNKGGGSAPKCDSQLGPSGCATTIGAGTAGPILYASASILAPLSMIMFALLAIVF